MSRFRGSNLVCGVKLSFFVSFQIDADLVAHEQQKRCDVGGSVC